MWQRGEELLRGEGRGIIVGLELPGIGRQENRPTPDWTGEPRFRFEARINRDKIARNGDGSVLCLAAESTEQMSRYRHPRLRLFEVEICVRYHSPRVT